VAEPAPATQRIDGAIRGSSLLVVVLVAVGAAVVSYRHAYELVHGHGESGAAAVIGPATVDGMIYASGMVLLQAARYNIRAPRLAYWGLWLGIVATVGANVAHGVGHGWIGALVSAWPAVALITSYEILMKLIRTGRPELSTAVYDRPEPAGTTMRHCPHRPGQSVSVAVQQAFLHGRDCLGDEPSQRQLAASFNVDRKKVAALVRKLTEPDSDEDPAEPAPSLNGTGPATAEAP
jgi:hypothetical protein